MDDNEIIDALGGTAKVARLCDVKAPSVSEWRKNGIPKPWRKFFQAIRPDLFTGSNADRRKRARRHSSDRREDGK